MERGELRGSEYITPEEIEIIVGVDSETARRYHVEVRTSFGNQSKYLAINQFCEYHDLDEDEVIELLNGIREVEVLILEEELEIPPEELNEGLKRNIKALEKFLENESEDRVEFVEFNENIHSPISFE